MKAPKVRAILLNVNKTTEIGTINIVVYVYDYSNNKSIVYFPTSIKVHKKSFINGTVKNDTTNKLIQSEITKVENLIIQLQIQGIEITKSSLEATKKKNELTNKPLTDLISSIVEVKSKNNTISNSNVYESIIKNIQEFEKIKKTVFTCRNINQKFIDDLRHYLLLKNLEDSTIKNYFVILKSCFKEFHKQKLLNDDYRNFEYPNNQTEKNLPTLNKAEINLLLKSRFQNKNDEKVRQKFLIQLFTGIRYSDLDQITKENIVTDNILIYTEKNETPLEIPINSNLNELLQSVDYNVKQNLHIQLNYFNEVLKRICKKINLNRKIQTVSRKNNLVVTKNKPLFDVISSHVARRTAITVLAEMGLTHSEIKSITGHKDIKSIDRYIKISNTHKTKIMEDYSKYLAL